MKKFVNRFSREKKVVIPFLLTFLILLSLGYFFVFQEERSPDTIQAGHIGGTVGIGRSRVQTVVDEENVTVEIMDEEIKNQHLELTAEGYVYIKNSASNSYRVNLLGGDSWIVRPDQKIEIYIAGSGTYDMVFESQEDDRRVEASIEY